MGSGIAIGNVPSVGKAQEAANKIFEVVDEPSKIDARSKEGDTKIEKGEIEFKNVEF